MKYSDARKLHIGYGIFLGVLTALVGLLTLLGVTDLYASGETFTAQAVGERMRALIVPACVWFVAALGGVILASFTQEERPLRTPSDAYTLVSRLRRRIPAGEGEEFEKEQRNLRRADFVRLAVRCICALFCALAAVMCAVYLFDASHFPAEDLNAEVIAMLRNVFPWVGAALAVCVGASVFESLYARRTLASVKRLIVLGRGHAQKEPCAFMRRKERVEAFLGAKWTVFTIRIALIALGVLFIGLGVANGGAADVLHKAVNICLECIGVG